MAEYADGTRQLLRDIPRPRLLVASLAVCLALLAGLGAWRVYQQHHPGPGPLGPSGQAEDYTSTGIPLGSSGVATFALIMLANPTATPAVIDDVRLVPSSEGGRVQLRRSWVARPLGGQAWAAFTGLPGQHYPDRRAAKGAQIPPRGEGGYVLGLTLAPRSASADLSWVNGVDVTYHIGGQTYRDRWHDQVVLCRGTTCQTWKTTDRWPPKPTHAPE